MNRIAAAMTSQMLVGSMVAAAIAFAAAGAQTVTLYAVKDNTLIESPSGDRSNGAGEGIFCGRLNSSGEGRKLRLVVAFDLTSIPPGSTVTAASLRLYLEQGHGGTQTHSVHRILAAWGEGTSDSFGGIGAPSTPNDATWIHRFYPNTFWASSGGDFVASASASASVGNNNAPFVWSGAGIINDVQLWVNNPDTNFGFMVRGNEVTLGTAKKFISKDWETNPDRPHLIVTYSLPPCIADVTNDGNINVQDLLAVMEAWGACPPPPTSCAADVSPSLLGDGLVNVADLLAVINGWGPCR